MKFLAIASFPFLLAACTASEKSADAAPPLGAPADSAISDAKTSEAPAAKRAPGQESFEPLQTLRALGTEPFWNVNVQAEQLTFMTPEDQVGVVMQGERKAVDGGVDLSGSNKGQPFLLSVRPGSCSDGMSDNQYAMTATFSVGDARYKGCAEAAR